MLVDDDDDDEPLGRVTLSAACVMTYYTTQAASKTETPLRPILPLLNNLFRHANHHIATHKAATTSTAAPTTSNQTQTAASRGGAWRDSSQ